MLKKVTIYTDGACSGNPGPGGYGALLIYGDKRKEINGGEKLTTNNRMEMMGAIAALQSLKNPCEVDLYTDSNYLRHGITTWLPQWKIRAWKTADKKPVKNQDLWMLLEEVASPHKINWHWVKGHSGHPENERADQLAREGILTLNN